MDRRLILVTSALVAAAALMIAWSRRGESSPTPLAGAADLPSIPDAATSDHAKPTTSRQDAPPTRSEIAAPGGDDAAAIRHLRVVLTVVPVHLHEHYLLSASARPESAGPPTADARVTNDVADLRVASTFCGSVEIYATHIPTAWRTCVARTRVPVERHNVELDLHALRAGDHAHNLLARIETPREVAGPFTLTLVPIADLGRVAGNSVSFTPEGSPSTVWINGLQARSYVPLLEHSQDGGADYRCEFAPVRVEGDTQVDLRAAEGGRLFVSLAGSVAGSAPWLTLRRCSGERLPHVQKRRSATNISVEGVAAGKLLVQAVGQDVVSNRAIVEADAVVPRTLDLVLGPACELHVRFESRLRPTALELRDLRTGSIWPLSDQEVAAFEQSRIFDARVPEGRYSLSVQTEGGHVRETISAKPPATHVVLR